MESRRWPSRHSLPATYPTKDALPVARERDVHRIMAAQLTPTFVKALYYTRVRGPE